VIVYSRSSIIQSLESYAVSYYISYYFLFKVRIKMYLAWVFKDRTLVLYCTNYWNYL